MSGLNLTQSRLRDVLRYDEMTGEFMRLDKPKTQKDSSLVAGYIEPQGYRKIRVDGCGYLAHRLAWLYAHGSWPKDQIDHINGIRHDNRLINLREATCLANNQNKAIPRNNTTGLRGVIRVRDKWAASIAVGGKKRWLGLYATPQEASATYLAARVQLYEHQRIPREFVEAARAAQGKEQS